MTWNRENAEVCRGRMAGDEADREGMLSLLLSAASGE
jgi:hypothetical protein